MAKIVMNKKIVDVAVNRGLIKEQKETKLTEQSTSTSAHKTVVGILKAHTNKGIRAILIMTDAKLAV